MIQISQDMLRGVIGLIRRQGGQVHLGPEDLVRADHELAAGVVLSHGVEQDGSMVLKLMTEAEARRTIPEMASKPKKRPQVKKAKKKRPKLKPRKGPTNGKLVN